MVLCWYPLGVKTKFKQKQNAYQSEHFKFCENLYQDFYLFGGPFIKLKNLWGILKNKTHTPMGISFLKMFCFSPP
jgi:hypothetical protein